MSLGLYKITRIKGDVGYDIFLAAVVAAESRDVAARIHPDGRGGLDLTSDPLFNQWVACASDVAVEYLGEAAAFTRPGVILASFRAG